MNSVWLVLLCLLLSLNSLAQETENGNGDEQTEVKISKLTLAKKDSKGNILEDVEVFEPKDIPIYCYVDLNIAKPTTITMKLVAVKAKGKRPNTSLLSVIYKTKKEENGATFRASPQGIWAVGDYRVDIYLNDKLAESKEFRVEDKKQRKIR